MARRNVVVGLDIGTTKVAVIVGEVREDGSINIIGLGEAPSSGLRKGSIVDIDHIAKAIEQAAEKAERMSGVDIQTAYVGITGAHISSFNNRGVVAVAREDHEITHDDVARVLQASQVVTIPPDRRIIHVIPREFTVDGFNGILDPVGMAGVRLEVETHIVTCPITAIQNLLKSINRAGIKAAELVFNPLASAEAVLLPAERELGAVLLDIGGGTCDLAIIDQGSLWFTAVIPIGGEYITGDLAVGLRTPITQAEVIKREKGMAIAALAPDNELVEIANVGGNGGRRVSRKVIASIIEPRLQEIFDQVKREIKRSGYKNIIPGGVVITGGSAEIQGLAELAASELDMPVRIGRPGNLGGLSDIVQDPSYATGIGLVLYGSRQAVSPHTDSGELSLTGIFDRIKSWFRDFF